MNPKLAIHIIEFHVVHHCNLTCAGCSHFAPQAKRQFLTHQEIERDVALAGERLEPEFVHIMGGEPLLHPQLADFLEDFRAGFPHATIKIVTNAVLHERMTGKLAEEIRRHRIIVAVSVYPQSGVTKEKVSAWCEQETLEVEFWTQDTFLDFINLEGTSDPVAARAVCTMAGAFNVREGRLFPCPVAAWGQFGGLPFRVEDGVALTSDHDELALALDRRRVNSCCRFCHESPVRVPHRMLRPRRELERL
jgi:hypothetical protein